MSRRRIVFYTFGSLGDLFPIVALARELKRRGHATVVATSPAHRARVVAAGVEFHSVRPDIDPLEPEMLRRAMDLHNGTRYIVCEMILPYLRPAFDDSVAAARGADLLVTHPVAVASVLAARKSGLPWASLALQPVSMLSLYDMPVFPGLPLAEWLARRGPGAQRWLLRLMEAVFARTWAPFHKFEQELGLPHSRNPFLFAHSPQLALALFSPLLAAPQPDWPPSACQTGFPFDDRGEANPPELQRFLDSGEPPLVFTLGSAAVGAAGDFFQQSVEVAHRLRRRAVFLVGSDSANQLPSLPPEMIALPYAPHSALFPQGCVTVHQGGIGTTGEAMRAGRPMLVVPYSHDQPDHAYRLVKMGVARKIPRQKYNVESATREIAALLADPQYGKRAAEVGERVRAEPGVTAGGDLLETLCGVRVAGGTAESAVCPTFPLVHRR